MMASGRRACNFRSLEKSEYENALPSSIAPCPILVDLGALGLRMSCAPLINSVHTTTAYTAVLREANPRALSSISSLGVGHTSCAGEWPVLSWELFSRMRGPRVSGSGSRSGIGGQG